MPRAHSRAVRRRLRNFCFTLNNPSGFSRSSEDESNEAAAALQRKIGDRANYLVFQLESGTNGTGHLQGYCELANPTDFSTIQGFFDGRAHIERRRGSPEQAARYCKKSDTRLWGPWETGDLSQQGKRTDVEDFARAIRSGANNESLLDEFPVQCARFPRFVPFVRATVNPGLRSELEVELHWGATGTGKTYSAFHKYPDLWSVPASDQVWYDGYDGQQVVLLDEFAGQMKLDLLLRVLDRYPLQVPVKGSFVWFRPSRIIVTSNSHPFAWYQWSKREEKCFALLSRFTKIYKYGNVTTPACPVPFKFYEEFRNSSRRTNSSSSDTTPVDETDVAPRFLDFRQDSVEVVDDGPIYVE